MPTILNRRASRVILCKVPFVKEEDGVKYTDQEDLVLLPGTRLKGDDEIRIVPSKTVITEEQAEVVRKHRASRRLFEAKRRGEANAEPILAWAPDEAPSAGKPKESTREDFEAAKDNNQKGRKAS